MLMMAILLYEDFAVRYNPARMRTPDAIAPDDHLFADPRDLFLHGPLAPRINSQLPPPGPPSCPSPPLKTNTKGKV